MNMPHQDKNDVYAGTFLTQKQKDVEILKAKAKQILKQKAFKYSKGVIPNLSGLFQVGRVRGGEREERIWTIAKSYCFIVFVAIWNSIKSHLLEEKRRVLSEKFLLEEKKFLTEEEKEGSMSLEN